MSWTVFFGGAKTIAFGVIQPHDTYHGDMALILDWMFYHGVMYRFAIHHWHDKNADQIKLAAQKGIVSKAVFAPERQIVRSCPFPLSLSFPGPSRGSLLSAMLI